MSTPTTLLAPHTCAANHRCVGLCLDSGVDEDALTYFTSNPTLITSNVQNMGAYESFRGYMLQSWI
jgi:hypothetical protein